MGDRGYFGPDFIKEAREQASIIQSHLKSAQSHQKTYADKRRRPLQFEFGDCVFEGISHVRCASIWCPWEASPSLCWTLQDFGPVWFCCLPYLAPGYFVSSA